MSSTGSKPASTARTRRRGSTDWTARRRRPRTRRVRTGRTRGRPGRRRGRNRRRRRGGRRPRSGTRGRPPGPARRASRRRG
ncbi:hypothetical protein BRC81_04995 [Halobacteriales archaeon QS_1_68_20]|nr:MAG: hypothetical protein BRC81_04995 [Halobacteriales archaeon QS_1_68_20]